jgi:hypothetical protein
MVSYRSSDGKQSYHQTDELGDAMQYVEHLRNAEGVEHARIFKMEELSFEYRPYYRVELATAPPPPAVSTESDWLTSTPDASHASEVSEAPAEDHDPLAAAWSMSERSESLDGESVGAGIGPGLGGRKGLFGR